MKFPLLFCSTLSILALSACSTTSSDHSTSPRYAKIQTTPAAPQSTGRPAAPAAITPTPPVAISAPAPVVEPAPAQVIVPAIAAPAPVIEVPVVVAESPAPRVPGIQTRRSGAVAHLAWTLPASPSGYRAIEVMRNTSANPLGRERVRAVRAELTSLDDTLPDATAPYWYWLKVTHQDGTIQNFGPFAASTKS